MNVVRGSEKVFFVDEFEQSEQSRVNGDVVEKRIAFAIVGESVLFVVGIREVS